MKTFAQFVKQKPVVEGLESKSIEELEELLKAAQEAEDAEKIKEIKVALEKAKKGDKSVEDNAEDAEDEKVQEKKLSAEDSYDALVNAMDKRDSKFNQAFWEFLETETADKGIYAGDATPDDLLDALSDKQLQKAYDLFSKKFKKLFERKVNEKVDVDKNDMGEIVISDNKLGIQAIIAKDVVELTFGDGDFKSEYMKKDIKSFLSQLTKELLK